MRKAYKLTRNIKKLEKNSNFKAQEKSYSVFDLASTNSCLKIINIHVSFILSLLSYPFNAVEKLTNNSVSEWTRWFDPFKFSYECFFSDLGIEYKGVFSLMIIKLSIPGIIIFIWFIFDV